MVEVEVDAPTAAGAPSTGRLVTTVVEGADPLPTSARSRRSTTGSAARRGAPAQAAVRRFALTDELRVKLDRVAVATLSALLRRRGYDEVSIDGVRTTKPGTKLVGRARTLRFVPHRPDLFATHAGGFNAQKRAFDSLAPRRRARDRGPRE